MAEEKPEKNKEEAEQKDQEEEEDTAVEELQASMTDGGEKPLGDEKAAEEPEEEPGPEKPVVKHEGRYYGTGRRKEAVARVWVTAGEGKIIINDKPAEEYFMNRHSWLQPVKAPLECVNFEEKINVWATVDGGGKTGQADAIKLGVARALVDMDENARHWLHSAGHMTRDDRATERKKINQPGARAKSQVSKR